MDGLLGHSRVLKITAFEYNNFDLIWSMEPDI